MRCPEILRTIMASMPNSAHVRRRAGVFCAMKRGPIPGININEIPRPWAIEGVKQASPLRRPDPRHCAQYATVGFRTDEAATPSSDCTVFRGNYCLKFCAADFPSTASNGPSVATFDDIPGLKCRPHPPHDSVLCAAAVVAPRNTRSPKALPVRNLSVQCATTPSNSNTSIQRPLARQRVMLSRRVIADYGLIRASESLPATYGFAAGSAAPKENRLEVGIQRFPN